MWTLSIFFMLTFQIHPLVSHWNPTSKVVQILVACISFGLVYPRSTKEIVKSSDMGDLGKSFWGYSINLGTMKQAYFAGHNFPEKQEQTINFFEQLILFILFRGS